MNEHENSKYYTFPNINANADVAVQIINLIPKRTYMPVGTVPQRLGVNTTKCQLSTKQYPVNTLCA